ncbi:hypothetical protein BCR32DRAFT_324298 [Anaeromyces robustus]|uniref:V-SNARE coiled-coil homology domain-containing protein n=1 Tax=Anaeromyces robustus TaxID=1754192 RepID=A0A1Y1XQI9_9FUNG|nr:hypothetical protein BCR32DRAFT_324298 [Anaeromyces robustus]|eukprot:ORX87776.1 hypothetical protein BCR32DRAFT_324298 [Anaeromyces robustus]
MSYNNKMHVQKQLNEVTYVMQNNAYKLSSRDEKVNSLQYKSDIQKLNNFKITTNEVKRKIWWKDMNLFMVLILIVLLIVMGYIFIKVGKENVAKYP